MIFQNTRGLDSRIQKYGCYFMSLLYNGSRLSGQPMSVERINQLRSVAVAEGYMKDDCYILDPAAIIALAGGRVEYLGKMSREYVCKEGEFEILKMSRMGVVHFVCGSGFGIVTYDPWRPGSQTAEYGNIDSKRVFKER